MRQGFCGQYTLHPTILPFDMVEWLVFLAWCSQLSTRRCGVSQAGVDVAGWGIVVDAWTLGATPAGACIVAAAVGGAFNAPPPFEAVVF